MIPDLNHLNYSLVPSRDSTVNEQQQQYWRRRRRRVTSEVTMAEVRKTSSPYPVLLRCLTLFVCVRKTSHSLPSFEGAAPCC